MLVIIVQCAALNRIICKQMQGYEFFNIAKLHINFIKFHEPVYYLHHSIIRLMLKEFDISWRINYTVAVEKQS